MHWNLSECALGDLEKKRPEVAVLPIGAVEPHNRHLPLGTDWLAAADISKAVCEAAWSRGAAVAWLPALPYGVDCNLMDFPMALHVKQHTLDAMVEDIVRSLYHYGIRKVLLFNGHGGNDFKPLVRQLQCDLNVHIFICNWWQVGKDHYTHIFERPDDHAGEMETSVALALWPERVRQDEAGPGTVRPYAFEALEEGWVATSRRFLRLNDHCAAGDPSLATAEKGKAYLELVVRRMADFLVALAEASVDETSPAPASFRGLNRNDSH